MAMLIYRFHRLIQSKLLWASFLVIVVFSFVIWGTQVPNRNKNARNAATAGTLHEKPVSQEDFRREYSHTYLSVVLSVGRPINVTPAIDAQLHKAAWQRIVALEEARKLGLTASDDEVSSAIQQYEGFSTEGRFNKAAYKAFVQNFLGRQGFSEHEFEEHIREEIILQKAHAAIGRSILISPWEVRRTFSSLSDRFKIEYATLTPEFVEKDVHVTPEEAKSFFDNDPKAFTIPEKVRVKYVRIAAKPFLAKVHVTPEEIQEYYDDHLDDFLKDTNLPPETFKATLTETNLTPKQTDLSVSNAPMVAFETSTVAAATSTNPVQAEAADTSMPTFSFNTSTFDLATSTGATETVVDSKYKPFEEVQDTISNQLMDLAAMDQAADKAMEYVEALTSDREGNAPTFEEAAKRFDFTVRHVGPFSQREELEKVDAGPDFNHAAFSLTQNPDSYFSDPIRASNSVYVLALEEKMPERVPTYDEVADEAMEKARIQALSDALSAKAKEIRDAADAAAHKGEPFTSVMKKYDLKAVTSEEFSASTGITNSPYSDILLRGIITLNQGEVSDLLPAEDAILIAYVDQRTPAGPAAYDSLKEQIITTIRRQQGRFLFEAWEDYLLQQAKFEEKHAVNVDTNEVDEADTNETDESSGTNDTADADQGD